MTDKQIRDRIVGALSVSMMPMEMEAECVAFLDRCIRNNKKTRADRIREMDDASLAIELYRFGDAPFCRNSKECAELLDNDVGIPEGKCMACVLQYIQEVPDDA